MKPPLACDNCRSRKKKCDRTYPICSQCLKTSRRCTYRVVSNDLTRNTLDNLNTSLQTWYSTGLPVATKYLDSTLAGLTSVLQPGEFPISTELRGVLDDGVQVDDYMTRYMQWIDPWLPIISRSYLQQCVRTSPDQWSSEQVLLLAAIKLLTRTLEEDNACTKEYFSVKVAFVHLEAYGAITLRTTQARFLLCFYEHGNGILQAAHTSLNICMGYLATLGLDSSHRQDLLGHDWLFEEQVRRLWWAGFVLDRLGCIQRPLLLKEPVSTKLLPSDEESWQLERYAPEKALTLSSPPTAQMGSFRLLVLASNLLGLALEYRSEIELHNTNLDEHVQQLYRTLSSFSTVLEIEGHFNVSIGAARGIINSAVLTLYPETKPQDPPNYLDSHANNDNDIHLPSSRRASAKLFLDRARIYMAGGLAASEEAAPFLLHWGYHSFRFYYHAQLADQCDEYQQALQDITDVFWVLNQKWKLASAYMKLVSASQAI